jgi:hypothetical protein
MFRSVDPLADDPMQGMEDGIIGRAAPTVDSQARHTFWRLDENIGVDFCISGTDFGLG